MRILNRPMFRYGGPINEGVMHGIRSNYAGGQRVGAFNVGSPVKGMFPKDVTGREHHVAPILWAGAAGLARLAPALYRAINAAKNIGTVGSRVGAGTMGTAHVGGAGVPMVIPQALSKASKIKNWAKGWWGGDPTVKSAKWGWKTLTSPGAKTLGEKTLKGITSPTGLLTTGSLAWMFWPDGTPKTGDDLAKAAAAAGKKPGRGDEGMYYTKPPVTKSAEELAAEAKAARTKKLNKYLDTMGYDKAKKSAIGDALIDASAIVQQGTEEGGSLKHADWSKMINQAIQTTSKRLDKPEQIREAVGLMLTKSEIEKDLEDPQTKKLRRLQIAGAEKSLAGKTTVELIQERMLKGDYPSGKNLARLISLNNPDANIKVIPSTGMDVDVDTIDYITAVVKKSHDEGKPFPPGNYVIKDRIINVDETGNITPIPISSLK